MNRRRRPGGGGRLGRRPKDEATNTTPTMKMTEKKQTEPSRDPDQRRDLAQEEEQWWQVDRRMKTRASEGYHILQNELYTIL